MSTPPPAHTDPSETGPVDVEQFWSALVTTALLGADRRDPPIGPPGIADVVADAVHAEPAERLLAAVAACTAVRRAGVLPGPIVDPLALPVPDPRPVCVPAAVARWHHIVSSWPVLEDEWMLTLIDGGWRLAPELVPALLARHRRDTVRRTRVVVAAGPLADWLVGHVPELASSGSRRVLTSIELESLGELPSLPIPPDLEGLLDLPGAQVATSIAERLDAGTLVESHRGVLVNLIARCAPSGLTDVADVLGSVDARVAGHGLAMSLADLAATRARLLDDFITI